MSKGVKIIMYFTFIIYTKIINIYGKTTRIRITTSKK